MAETSTTNPFAMPTFPVTGAAANLLVDVNRALVTSGERAIAVQREAAGELTAELKRLGAIKEVAALAEGQAQYANAVGKLAMSVAGEMFDIQRDLQRELTEILSAAFTVRPSAEKDEPVASRAKAA